VGDWQDISTGPPDGSRVFLFHAKYRLEVFTGLWNAAWGWHKDNGSLGNRGVTHWAPLPAVRRDMWPWKKLRCIWCGKRNVPEEAFDRKGGLCGYCNIIADGVDPGICWVNPTFYGEIGEEGDAEPPSSLLWQPIGTVPETRFSRVLMFDGQQQNASFIANWNDALSRWEKDNEAACGGTHWAPLPPVLKEMYPYTPKEKKLRCIWCGKRRLTETVYRCEDGLCPDCDIVVNGRQDAQIHYDAELFKEEED
jgi:hypothetical protein